MNILVQKFGGTSVESNEKMLKVSEIVKNAKAGAYDVVVVVSAMGRKGAPYATDTLIDLCKNVNEDVPARELDLIMSCGEIISGTILVNVLKKQGIDAVFLTGGQAGIITNGIYGDSSVTGINSTRIIEELKNSKVVVIAGFQGITEEGEVTTLGRGGSDTSAVIVGKGLGVEVVEIYTDVDGIMTADPKIEPKAKVIENINYDEVFQMADKGAKVIHPRAVEIAKNSNIVLKIKNTNNPSGGTCIGSFYGEHLDSYRQNDDNNLMTAVAHKNGVAQVIIKDCSEGVFTNVLNRLEENKISIDMINFFVKDKAFVVDSSNVKVLTSILTDSQITFEIIGDCSKVTLIGSRITGIPGVMAKIVRCLTKDNIKILQTSDSNMTISCLIKESDLKNAVGSFHKEFNLY